MSSLHDALRRSAARRGISLERRDWSRKLRFLNSAYAGLVTTAVIVMMTYAGAFAVPERWFYDLRTMWCQQGRPPPTQQLVHVDIDDKSLDEIGKWPWPRADIAAIIDEIAEAKPGAVAFDILFSEPEKALIVRTVVDGEEKFTEQFGDALMERALEKLGSGIVAYSFTNSESPEASDGLYKQIRARLYERPGLGVDDVVAGLSPTEKQAARLLFFDARKDAVSLRVRRALVTGQLALTPGQAEGAETGGGAAATTRGAATRPVTQFTLAEMRAELEGETGDFGTPLERLIQDTYQREQARLALNDYRLPLRPSLALLDRAVEVAPLPGFTRASGDAAFVTYLRSDDGFVRSIPLVAMLDGQPSPTLGLALALRTLGVPRSAVRVSRTTLSFATPDGREHTLPVRGVYSGGKLIEGMFDVPWFGGYGEGAWEKMYDLPGGAGGAGGAVGGASRSRLSLAQVWQSIQTRNRLAANNRALRAAYLTVLDRKSPLDAAEEEKRAWDELDTEAFRGKARALLDDEVIREYVEFYKDKKTDELDDKEKVWVPRFLGAVRSIPGLAENLRPLAEQGRELRAQLWKQLHGKALLVGWTATGKTDFVPTPLHASAPGVTVHGVVFNAVMTGSTLRFAPAWLTLMVTAALGALTSWLVAKSSPQLAAFGAVVLGVGYTLANAVGLFGFGGYVLGLAGPLTAVVVCWAGGSVVRFMLDRAERTRILKRFRTYVDPQLVNYMLENPDRDVTAGERRDITVCFTDLAGFTTLSEALGERTVGLLNDYFGVMIPLIRKHGGYLNKLLGDGMMFFYNAPLPNSNHTADAFDTVLEMQQVLLDFNRSLQERGLPTVQMRVGITRGSMIAGDAGGDAAGYSDYTVLGDVVNLASRLEGANKASGTLIMCNRDARDAVDALFLTRPIGTLQVVGKTEGVETFEVMTRRATAGETQVELAAMTEAAVTAYRSGDLDRCEARLAEMVARFGESKLTKLYHHNIEVLRETGLPEGFGGTIVLETK